MSTQEKLVTKLKNPGSTLTWNELISLLKGLGFRLLESAGSRVKMILEDPPITFSCTNRTREMK